MPSRGSKTTRATTHGEPRRVVHCLDPSPLYAASAYRPRQMNLTRPVLAPDAEQDQAESEQPQQV